MVARADITLSTTLRKRHHSLYANLNRLETEKQHKNGADHRFLVQQNFELLRALGELEKTCSILREENSLLRKSSAPETEEKVKRLRKKNTELAVLAKRLEERARKLQEANLKMGSPVPLNGRELEKLLRQSQMEVLRLQRQLSITSSIQRTIHNPDPGGAENCEEPTEEECAEKKESELTKKRKECESLEHEVKKRKRKCLDLESRLEDEQAKNAQLKEEADLLRRKTQLLKKNRVENDELREELSKVTAQHNYVLEENQRLRAKLENLEQVLKRMRDVAERRQQLELEHEQALAILKFKQDEIKRLQLAQLFARREHEGVVQMLESTLDCMQSKVRDLEEKCRSQSAQFGLLSQELENFRLQASKADLAGSGLLMNSSFSVLTNGVGLSCEQDYTDSSWDMESLSEIAFWSLERGDNLSSPEDVAATLRMGTTPHTGGLPRVERSPVTKHRELPTISVSKSASSSSKSETTNVTSKSNTHLTPHKSSPAHEVDTASEVEELDIDIALAPYTASRETAKLQVFIARYSYNPYDGPNDNPEMELPLTAGEYIYVYGGMDDDGFYEGELMDGRRGLVPSNFVERLSDDDVMGSHPEETSDMSHNTLLNSSLHSASNQHHLHTGVHASERTEAFSASGPASASSNSALGVSAPLTNGLDLDLEEMEVDTVPYPRKLKLIKQLAKSIIISWDPPLVPAGWGNVWSYNVYVDQELRLNVPFGAQTKAVLERLDINLKAYRVSVQSLTEKGLSDQLRCSMLIGRDVCVAPTQLRVDSITATSASLSWLPCNSNYVHIVSLNEQECELVKAGCYSLCLNKLLPSQQYTVKVEARPHRTAWELPVERREHRSATINFSTLMAVSSAQSGNKGPPDAPLDVQLEHGPSPGIALISWLPVTIDNAGTSNGVHVTGYTIYADKKKVLEVSSPTAGSALLGPSQIQSLQTAQDLTVRTMSAHGESSDSFPVNVPSKLAAIMAGPAAATLVVPTLACTPVRPTNLSRQLTFENSAAKVSITGLTVDDVANCLHIPPSEAFLSSASFAKALTSPLSAVSIAACEATLPVTSTVTPVMNMTPPTSSALQPSPVIKPVPAETTVTQVVTLEQRRNTDSPGTIRPFPSISEFIEDPCAIHGTPERIPTPPKTPITDLLNPQDTLILRPPSTSSLDSEVDEELENKRLVSIEDFLRQDHDTMYDNMQKGCNRGLVEHLTDNIRSDLFDILEEEEEDLNSDHFREASTREYTIIANREPHKISRCEAVPSWVHDSEQTSKAVVLEDKRLKGCFESPKTKGDTRIFVALFPYDPATMSPNPDASEEELLFREGQIITVYGDKDSDGFYQGESGGRLGYVPCNMVSEIQVEDEETRQQLLQQGFLSTEASMEKIDPSQVAATCAKGKPVQGSRKMVAIFDYDPRESSPNTDIEVELTFSAGDVINVIGDMDEDGFFYGDLHGQRGLVPSNFLQAFPEKAPAEDFSAQPAQEHKKESQGTSSTEPQEPDLYSIQDTFNLQPEPAFPNRLAHVDPLPHLQLPGRTTSNLVPVHASPPTPQLQTDSSTPAKKKKRGIFSKGKKLFKRFGFSKKE
ncbi:RIMS-binding protein 2 isoform X9 [Nerophis ophidion]|uniref:RIMS-binding protein 2 isoform X9 n=1 Tax=Nerophis ophidion TaxID=159077 RepID=UPI002ADFFE23|nr:RIMS-binding protein 2 isoform X9 [Nerophis ophidion]